MIVLVTWSCFLRRLGERPGPPSTGLATCGMDVFVPRMMSRRSLGKPPNQGQQLTALRAVADHPQTLDGSIVE